MSHSSSSSLSLENDQIKGHQNHGSKACNQKSCPCCNNWKILLHQGQLEEDEGRRHDKSAAEESLFMKDISHKMDLLFKDVQAIKKAISDPKKDSVETSLQNVTFLK